jgi:hypothetical protein
MPDLSTAMPALRTSFITVPMKRPTSIATRLNIGLASFTGATRQFHLVHSDYGRHRLALATQFRRLQRADRKVQQGLTISFVFSPSSEAMRLFMSPDSIRCFVSPASA